MLIGHVSRLIDSGSESATEVARAIKPEDPSWGCAGGTSATVALGLNHRHGQLWGRTVSFSAPASSTVAAGPGHGPADGINSQRRDKKIWDDERRAWVPGQKGKNGDEETQWLHEVPAIAAMLGGF
ncbi:hypothetical protein EDB85DRAFT_2249299 [Lactarius pseudohatsudake]|nr:hypothetical protein EDB85DRAFT_2249299 [Lactarius pseudohatsudake]